jgi:hypothetical protein
MKKHGVKPRSLEGNFYVLRFILSGQLNNLARHASVGIGDV